MNIETYGNGERLNACRRLLARLSDLPHTVLLPIPTTRDGVYVFGADVKLKECLVNLTSESIIAGYGIPKSIVEDAKSVGAKVLELCCDEEFLLENAHITAVGALGYILTHVRRVPKDTVFGVIGYGRIGSKICEMLMSLGGRVCIYTSKQEKRIELGRLGVETREAIEGKALDLSEIDVLINTAPISWKESFPTGRVENLCVIELASGENFGGIEGIVRLPAVPERNYSESGGRAYFNAIMRELSEGKE